MDKKTAAKLIAFGVLLWAAVSRLDVVIWAIAGFIGVLKPIILGIVMAFVLNIPLRLIESLGKKRVIPRGVAILLAIVVVIAIMAAAGLILLPQLVAATMALVGKLPEWAAGVREWAIKLYDDPQLRQWISELSIDWQSVTSNVIDFMKNGAFSAITSAGRVASDVAGSVTRVIIAFIIALGCLSGKERILSQIKRTARAFIKSESAEKIIDVCRLTHRAYTGFFTAQLTEAVILGLLVMTGMLIIGFPRPFMVATLIAVGALVPLFGSFIAAVASAFFLAAEFSLSTGLWFMLFFVVLQQIEGNVIYPRVMGSRIGLPSIWVLIAVVVGGNAFGIIGMIFFVPLVSVAYALVGEEVKRRESRLRPN